MLFENVKYRDELPFEISFLNIGEESKHCHKDLEILLVLRGVTHYQIYHTDYELNTGDLIIADIEDLHQIHDSSDDVLMLSMHIDTSQFEELYPNIQYMFFVCEECMEGPASNPQMLDNKLALLKNHIANLAFHYIKEDTSNSILLDEINKLVAILVEHFQGFYMEDYQYKTTQQDMSHEDLQQLCRITRYIILNYRNKITLEDISKLEHLSSYYLSHLIKENLGFNFQNFVNAIRLEFAEKKLVFTNMTLMQISQDCGFSSPNYFNKCFSAWYGKTPAQYRKDYVPCERSERNAFTQEEAFHLLSRYLNDAGKPDAKVQFLSPEMNFDSGGFAPLNGPTIILDSIHSIMVMDRFRETVLKVCPSAIIMDRELLHRNRDLTADMLPDNITIGNITDVQGKMLNSSCIAEAFDDILVRGISRIPLCGSAHSLFSINHIRSATYRAYLSLMEHGIPEVKAFEKYALMKTEYSQTAIFFNTDHDVDLSVHISKKSLPDCDIIIRRRFSSKYLPDTVREKLSTKKEIPPSLLDRITQCSNGKVTFPAPNRDIDFTLGHMEALILEFVNL